MQNSVLLFFNIGTPELLVIMFVALLLFGGRKLPELARGLGQGIREFKDASDGVKREIHRNINAVNEDLSVNLEDNANTVDADAKKATGDADTKAVGDADKAAGDAVSAAAEPKKKPAKRKSKKSETDKSPETDQAKTHSI